MTSKQIKRLREAFGESAEAFGKRIGVSKKTVEAWEYLKPPQKGPALILLQQLAKQAEVNVN